VMSDRMLHASPKHELQIARIDLSQQRQQQHVAQHIWAMLVAAGVPDISCVLSGTRNGLYETGLGMHDYVPFSTYSLLLTLVFVST
jgi:hypothetical protein